MLGGDELLIFDNYELDHTGFPTKEDIQKYIDIVKENRPIRLYYEIDNNIYHVMIYKHSTVEDFYNRGIIQC